MVTHNVLLFDDNSRSHLLPFTFTRPVADIRIGILTIREKWEFILGTSTSTLTADHLSKKFNPKIESSNLLINGSILPDQELFEAISSLQIEEGIVADNKLIAAIVGETLTNTFSPEQVIKSCKNIPMKNEYLEVDAVHDIFSKNGQAIQSDFSLITEGKASQPLDNSNQVIGDDPIFVESGAKISCSILNTENGPIYIGKNSEVMEGSMIRGPFALCEGAILKMGTKIYGPTTIGPFSKAGGEVTNSVIFANSNKAHDGFLGNSVVGEWCNLGADTNSSNLKNNYAEVRIWNYNTDSFDPTGRQFCGLFMGDHSKSGINTMFNTGTVVGVSANIFGSGFPRNFIPSFSWGGASEFSPYQIDKALEVAENVMKRRDKELTDIDKNILHCVFELTEKYRNY